LYDRWKFTILLGALVLLVVVHPLAQGNAVFPPLLFHVLAALVIVAAVLALFQRRGCRVAALVLGTPSVVGLFTNYFLPATSPVVAGLLFHLLPVVFLCYTLVVILRTVFRDRNVSLDQIHGAICGYLLLGLAFAHLYCLAELFWPGSFHLQEYLGALPDENARRFSLLAYFSFVTLTTLGYGDITPQSGPARTLAWVEAVMGQFYVAVIIAELIALRVSAAVQNQRPEGPPASGST
jgi:hypothetical protein